jgi:hypothetical protein
MWTSTLSTADGEIDVLLTHGPPLGHLDLDGQGNGFLLRELWRARPRLVVCGHIQQGRGREELAWDGMQAAYNRVVLRDRGIIAVLSLALRVAFRWVTGWRAKGGTTLVNAVVVQGVEKVLSHPAVVVEL